MWFVFKLTTKARMCFGHFAPLVKEVFSDSERIVFWEVLYRQFTSAKLGDVISSLKDFPLVVNIDW